MSIRISGDIAIRDNHIAKAGDMVGDHEHNFDHTSIVIRGAVRIKAKARDGSVWERDFVAGEEILILATVRHEITALVDDTLFFCVYAHRNAEGLVIPNFAGYTAAYQ